ncbi:MAG: hypothetical protein Q8N65_02025 [bacterium]|nr:hypothetical protein [bacterium]
MTRPNFKNFSLLAKLSLFLLILLGLVFPLYQARAFLGPLAGLIAANIFAFALQLVVIITWVILLICYAILIWVLSPAFITLPYTSGGIVDIGWPITRDLANMGFVFALLVIGVATALRYPRDEGYKVKKALPTLIGIILLVNFTPVITGVVMDAANIIMVFFIQEISGFQSLITILGNQFGAVVASFTNLQGILTGQIALIARSLVLIGFNLMTAMFLLLFSLIFIMRYIAIWALVILSPLAFFAYVLPGTKKYFTMWWSQFLQWAFVGVSAAFFLYLAEQLLVTMSTTPFIAAPTPPIGILQPLTDIFNTVMVYIVIEAFLAFGFFASLSSGAVGASAVISTGKQWTSAAGKAVGSFAKSAGKSWGRAGLEKTGLGEAATKIANRMATYAPKSKFAQAALAPALDMFRATGRKGIEAFSVSGKGEIQAGIGEAEKKIEMGAVDLVKSEYLSAADTATRIQKLIALANKGKTKDIEELIAKTGTQVSDDVVNAHRIYGRGDEVLKVMPTLPAMEEVIRQKAKLPSVKATPLAMFTPAQRTTFDNEQKDFFRKMKTPDAGRININTFDSTKPASYSAATSEMIIKNWDGRHIANLYQEQGSVAIDVIKKRINDLALAGPPPAGNAKAWLTTHNPSLVKYFDNAAHQTFASFDARGNLV